MKPFGTRSTVVLALLCVLAGARLGLAGPPPPQEGKALPAMELPVPENPANRDYLGLPDQGMFRVSQIKAEIVLIEVFSMYCPACQKEAGRVNELYNLIESDPDTRGRIKLMGIGAGNTPFEVNVFRKKYDVPFPLFPDEDFSLHHRLGEVRTPFFIGVKIKPDGKNKVFLTRLGGFEEPAEFLNQLLKSSQ